MSNKNGNQEERQSSYGTKLALTAGSLSSLYLLPMAVAQAGMVTCTGTATAGCGSSAGLTLSLADIGGSAKGWDVDGDSVLDFNLFPGDAGKIFLKSATNGRGIAVKTATGHSTTKPLGTGKWRSLARMVNVGSANKSANLLGTRAGYAFKGDGDLKSGAQAYRTMWWKRPAGKGGGTVPGQYLQQFVDNGDNYINFAFSHNGSDTYGWAQINMNSTNHSFTIVQWAYNVPAPDVRVPEPSTAALALIGMGAGGIRAWRARKKSTMDNKALAT